MHSFAKPPYRKPDTEQNAKYSACNPSNQCSFEDIGSKSSYRLSACWTDFCFIIHIAPSVGSCPFMGIFKNADKSANYTIYCFLIFSIPPMYGLRASGIITPPSSCWQFSSIATTVLPTARPEPLRVWTNLGFPPSFGLYFIFALLACKSSKLLQD